ncbi:MAG: Na/Pi cotransporter family protein [Blautia sp.]|nr:Na/Pi cotransporter family protein [Blautia sp.]
MDIFDILSLFGGLAMFLYGMRLMGDGLKQGSSGTLKRIMEKVTNNPVKALLLGTGVTALIQSSTATIVITSGLVAAGILTLHQSLGIIIGANVGTTVTGQIIRLLDIDASKGSLLQLLKPSTLAPIALIIGIILIMGKDFKNSKTFGNVAIGFGILFSGLLNMTGTVDKLAESGIFETLLGGLGSNILIGYTVGAGVAFVLQSSSAAVGILQAFSASGLLTFQAVYPVIVGIYLGDCVTTAIVCSIGAKTEARRVGIVNILYNLSKTFLVLSVVAILHQLGFLNGLWEKTVTSGIIANANSIFNITCAIAFFPVIGIYEALSRRIVPDEKVPENPYKEKLDALNPAFFRTPALALNSCYDLLLAQLRASIANIRLAFSLLSEYDEKKRKDLDAEEDNIDLLTDQVSRYMVNLLPYLHENYQVSILDQYYKVVTEFERLGDHAVNIGDGATHLASANVSFSPNARQEIRVMQELLEQILQLTEQTFRYRDTEAAYRIEALMEVAGEMASTMKVNHLKRMVAGTCNVYADVIFMNLLSDFSRIADVCSNVAEATLIRVNPQLASNEHSYFTALRSGKNEQFNKEYQEASAKYNSMLTTESIE